MPSKESKQGANQGTGMPPGPTQMISDTAALQNYGFNAMSGMSVAWVEALSEMGSEVLSFVADRIKEDVRTQHKMLHCNDMGELQEIQSEFVQTAIEQYRVETGKLVEMSRDLVAATGGGNKGN
ncbi:MAG: phasin family protein [Silicimonas sp.]|nr:phasin family protein [Silicimonas sp.]